MRAEQLRSLTFRRAFSGRCSTVGCSPRASRRDRYGRLAAEPVSAQMRQGGRRDWPARPTEQRKAGNFRVSIVHVFLGTNKDGHSDGFLHLRDLQTEERHRATRAPVEPVEPVLRRLAFERDRHFLDCHVLESSDLGRDRGRKEMPATRPLPSAAKKATPTRIELISVHSMHQVLPRRGCGRNSSAARGRRLDEPRRSRGYCRH